MYLINKINEDVEALKNDVVTGRIENFDTYKLICGRVNGLLRAKEHIIDLKERLEREDD
jgi:hypothetical protein